MADKSRVFEIVLLEEGFDIFGKGDIVVCLIVRRVAVVSCVNCVDWPREFAREDTGLSVRVCVIHVRGLLLADTLVVSLATE